MSNATAAAPKFMLDIAKHNETDVLQALSKGQIDIGQAGEMIDQLKAIAVRKASAANAGPRSITFKVSEKGAVSVYGLNARFPITLYGDQWTRLLGQREQLEAFIEANKGKLSVKGQ